MTSKQYLVTHQNIGGMLQQIGSVIASALRGGDVLVTLSRKARSMDQNRKLWPMLRDVSTQVAISGNEMDPETWKHVLTAAFRQQEFVQGLNHAVVVIPLSTSSMSKKDFSDLIEFIYGFGANPEDFGAHAAAGHVVWSEPAMQLYEEMSR